MNRNTVTCDGTKEILAADEFWAIPVTVVGEGTVYAGTPLTESGEATTGANAVGILLHDVDTSMNPTGAIVRQGILNVLKAQEHSGIEYNLAALKSALPGIKLRSDIKGEGGDEPVIEPYFDLNMTEDETNVFVISENNKCTSVWVPQGESYVSVESVNPMTVYIPSGVPTLETVQGVPDTVVINCECAEGEIQVSGRGQATVNYNVPYGKEKVYGRGYYDLGEKTELVQNDFQNFDTYIKKIVLPSEVVTLDEQCLANSSDIESLVAPGVERVNDDACSSATSLVNVEIPQAVTIGARAFMDAGSITEMNLPNVTSIGDSAFNNCTALARVNIPKVETIGMMAFESCTSLERIDLPSTVQTIASDAFSNCTCDIYCDFAEGEVANAPWGTSGTVHYKS